MIVHYERSGGFAGLTTRVTVDSADLPATQKQELRELVEKAFPPNQAVQTKPTKPDQFNYQFIVEEKEDSRAFAVNDESLTEDIRHLSKWLVAKAQADK